MNELQESGKVDDNEPPVRGVRRWRWRQMAATTAGAYLGIVALSFAFVAYDVYFVDHADATMSPVLLYMVTMPASILEILVEFRYLDRLPYDLLPATGWVMPGICALIQAWVLWRLLRGRRVA